MQKHFKKLMLLSLIMSLIQFSFTQKVMADVVDPLVQNLLRAQSALEQSQAKMLDTASTDEYNAAVSDYEKKLGELEKAKEEFKKAYPKGLNAEQKTTTPSETRKWSLNPSTGKKDLDTIDAIDESEDQVIAQIMENVVDPGKFTVGGVLGATEVPGVGVGAKATYRRYLGGSFIPTYGSLEIHAGIPVVRIIGEGQIYPIALKQYAFTTGRDGMNVLELAIIPLTIKGKLTFQNINGNAIGNSSFVASPDFAVNFLHMGPVGKAVFISNVGASVGIAGGVAHDGTGIGSILGPKFALRGAFAFEIEGNHRVEFKTKGQFIPSVLPTINGVGATGVSGEFHAEANYSRIFDTHGNRFFIGLKGDFERYDVKGGSGYNGYSGYTGYGPYYTLGIYDPGVTGFFGAQGGVSF